MLIEIPEVVTRNEYKPAILAVILTKNKIADLIKVIDSLFEQKHHDGSFVNICVAVGDTGSDFDNRLKWKKYWEILSEEKKSRIIKFDKMVYNYSICNNEIVEKIISPQYTPDYILFCNNDVEIIKDNTLSQMLQCFELYPNVGTVGCQSLFSTNFVQHQGIECIRTGNNQVGFTHTNINTYNYDYLPRICFGASAFFMLTPTQTFYRFGKFNTQVKSCLQDAIYAIDNLVNGNLNIVCNSSIVYHDEGSSRKKEKLYQEMLQYDLSYTNAYLNFVGNDGKTRAEIIAPFIKQGNYIR